MPPTPPTPWFEDRSVKGKRSWRLQAFDGHNAWQFRVSISEENREFVWHADSLFWSNAHGIATTLKTAKAKALEACLRIQREVMASALESMATLKDAQEETQNPTPKTVTE